MWMARKLNIAGSVTLLGAGFSAPHDTPEAVIREILPMGREIVPRTVLVVDDEPLIRWSLSEGLAEAGWIVRQAATGVETRLALETLEGEPFVVVLDLRLPDVADLSLVEEVRRRRPDVPVIVMSAHGSLEDIRRVRAAGVYRFIDKPFDVHAVVDLVRSAADTF
jgi:DNA-binding NtrC family response regulator